MSPWHPEELALLTDLYALTMAQAYVQAGKAHETATLASSPSWASAIKPFRTWTPTRWR
jgi:hypothetical protein